MSLSSHLTSELCLDVHFQPHALYGLACLIMLSARLCITLSLSLTLPFPNQEEGWREFKRLRGRSWSVAWQLL